MKSKLLYFFEIFFAFAFIALAAIYVGKTFYFCDNSFYLNTTDALPIYTKAIYIAKCMRNMQWPSWFPNWYCGSSVSQYYPPLTYLIMGPMEFCLQNPTLCLKMYIFSGLLIGGMGVWKIYFKYIGRVFGILAGVLYVTLPYFTISFLFWGTVAQVPIIAAAPWYVICCIEYYKKPKPSLWLAVIALTFLLLLSHVMHGFMIAICAFITMLILSIVRKKNVASIIMWGIGTGVSAGLLGFWWVTGVLPLENPDVPALASDAAKDVTANLTWFFPAYKQIISKIFPDMKNNIDAYFPFSIILIAIFSFIFIRNEKGQKKYVLLFLYIQTGFAFLFSFGSYLPFYKYIPLSNQLVPGRILTQAAIGAVVLTAYFIINLAGMVYKKIKIDFRQALNKAFAFLLIILTAVSIWVSYLNYPKNVVSDYSFEKSLYSQLDSETPNFGKGRLAWFGENFSSINAYFAYLSNYNMVSGWNIEGTSTADYLRYQNTALSYAKGDYLLKNIYDMNVQTCFVNKNNFPWLCDLLKNNGFDKAGGFESIEIMKKKSHSYFMEQLRNSIVIGKASNVFLSDYPWFVKGYSSNPTEYETKHLNNYDIIYYCEPEINNLKELKQFENQLTYLAQNGKKVFVEFGRTIFPAPVLGVSPYSFKLEGEYTVFSGDELDGEKFPVNLDNGYIVQLFGTDDVQYKLERDYGNFTVDFLGTKNIGDNKIYFIGGPQSQLKGFAFNYLTGKTVNNALTEQRDEVLRKIISKVFNSLEMYKNLDLPAFNAQNVRWGANSCEFTYVSDSNKRITASITYTPRWKILIDGVEIGTERVDNMLTFTVPSGSHSVIMKYSMTIFGMAGVTVTIFSIIALFAALMMYKKILLLFNNITKITYKYFITSQNKNA